MTRRPCILAFLGFQNPNTTQVPDELFDELLPQLSGAELKVLLYIVRRTYGFKKLSDNISLSQIMNGIQRRDGEALDHGTGLSRDAVTRATKELEDYGIIVRHRRRSDEKGDEPTTYGLRFASVPQSANRTRGVQQIGQGGVRSAGQGGVRKSDPQQTVLQETVKQQTEKDSLRHSSLESLISNVRNGGTERGKTETDTGGTTPKNNRRTVDMGSLVRTATPPASALPRGITTLAAVLTERRSPRPKVPSEARQAIGAYIRDFALEFGDQAPLRSTVTRAVHLYEGSELSIGDFIGRLHTARSVVKEYSGNVTKGKGDASRGWRPANKVPYFFAVLEDQLGLRDTDDATEQAVEVGDNQRDRQSIPPATPTSHEPPQRQRRTIGGPLVRVVPVADNDDRNFESAVAGPSAKSSRTAQNRPKPGRVPVIASNQPLRRTGP